MLSAPPLPPPPAAVAISSSSSSCVFVADVPQDMAKEEEGSNVFASLMPNLFSRLQPCDDSITEQEFQDIHRLLTLEREKDDETDGLESSKKKPSPSGKSFYARGKENTLPSKLSQRNKLLRRESSSRITSHRKPFVVDLRSFGSILNNDALGECKKPQDVHAFWEAADEREASEAIMRKLRGGSESCSQKSVHGNSNLRRLGVRRKNSQRTTTRLRGFAVELPLSAEQVQSLDDEQLEEEEDATEESSFTFVSNPEFRVEKGMHEKQNIEKQVQVSQWMNPVQSDGVALEIAYMDKSAKMRDQAVDDQDILSDGKSPLIDTKGNGHPTFSQMTAASEDGPNEGVKSSHASEIVEIAPSNQVVETLNSPAAESDDRHVEKEGDVANEVDMKVTPYNRNAVTKSTPFTSPTPPSNPLAALGLRKDTIVEDIGKRRLDFDDTMNSPILEPDLPAPTIQNTPCLQNSSASPESPKTLVQEKSPELVEEINPISSDALPTEAIKSPEQNVTKPLKKTCTKRKRPLHDRRDSLKGAGTNWDDGVRRSTRIRSRPLEWWRGERFLLGRVHKSLSTVIGIKYSSPPPCWPKRGAKVPEFKVESYVPEKYAKYVRFAALY